MSGVKTRPDWRVSWCDGLGQARFAMCAEDEGFARELAARLLADGASTDIELASRGAGSALWKEVAS